MWAQGKKLAPAYVAATPTRSQHEQVCCPEIERPSLVEHRYFTSLRETGRVRHNEREGPLRCVLGLLAGCLSGGPSQTDRVKLAAGSRLDVTYTQEARTERTSA